MPATPPAQPRYALDQAQKNNSHFPQNPVLIISDVDPKGHRGRQVPTGVSLPPEQNRSYQTQPACYFQF